MSDTSESVSRTTKHQNPIITTAGKGRKGSRSRVKRPGSGRQLRIVVWVFAVIAIAIVGAYVLLRPTEDMYKLRDYDVAFVEVRTIQDDLQLGATVRARTEITVRAPTNGILETVTVDVGDWVAPGQIVAVLDSEQLRNAYESEQSNLVQSERTYENLLLTREQAVLLANRQRTSLADVLDHVTEDLANAEDLYKLGTITQGALEAAKNAAVNAGRALTEHDEDADIERRFFELAKQGSEDNLAYIRKNLVDLEQQIADTRIEATVEGQVVWVIDTIAAVGEKMNENAQILQIADTRDPFIETAIEEQYVSEIEIGQEVTATIMGLEFPGYIERIGLLAITPASGGAPEVDLDIRVEVSEIEAIPGSTALAEIIVGVVPDALVLPRGPYLSTGNNVYLYKVEGETATRIRATFGAITESFVEILSGAVEEDKIIISSYQNFIDFENIDLGGNND